MSGSLQVIVSHPGKQGNVYQRPRAAEQAGCAVVFLTGLYYFPERLPYSLVRHLWRSLREPLEVELEKRRQEGLSPGNVVTLLGPILETTLRPLGLMDLWGDIHDRLASSWLRSRAFAPAQVICHCFQGSAVRTLQVARRMGAVRILEVTLPPMPVDQCQDLAEAGADFTGSQIRAAERLRRELDRCDWAVAQSAFSVKSIEALGFPPDRIMGVPLGVDTKTFRPSSMRPRAGFRALFVGSIGRRKGFHHLLRAWESLNLKDAELTIVGDTETPEARRLLAGNPKNVVALGNLSFRRLVETYQSADILVHPSLAEGGCNVVHEALACGLPCVVTTNATSAVRDGIEGYVVPVGGVQELKDRITALHGSHELRDKMSRAARVRAEELSWEAYLCHLGSIYLDLARDPLHLPGQAGISSVFGTLQPQSQARHSVTGALP